MLKDFQLQTDRVILRRWRMEDVEPLAAINADGRVMEHFQSTQSRAETESLIERIEMKFKRDGFSFWAAETRAGNEFIGFVGLNVPPFESMFTPCVEIGWRLGFAHWGKGYAQEAARASLQWGFEERSMREIVSFTTVRNERSRHVMEKIGMKRDPADDFEHPLLPEGHRLRPHVLYRIQNPAA